MNFIPHGWCIRWDANLLIFHVVSDAIITLAYYAIPILLVALYRKGGGKMPYWANWKLLAYFATFIFACGTTHLMNIVVIWYPVYWLDGAIKAATALASIGTAVELWVQMPRLVKIPGALRASINDMANRMGVRLES